MLICDFIQNPLSKQEKQIKGDMYFMYNSHVLGNDVHIMRFHAWAESYVNSVQAGTALLNQAGTAPFKWICHCLLSNIAKVWCVLWKAIFSKNQ